MKSEKHFKWAIMYIQTCGFLLSVPHWSAVDAFNMTSSARLKVIQLESTHFFPFLVSFLSATLAGAALVAAGLGVGAAFLASFFGASTLASTTGAVFLAAAFFSLRYLERSFS